MITQWADANDNAVIGWAEDTDISGSIDPFETPQLGDWLNNRAPEFDVIATWKLDRLSRNAIKLNKGETTPRERQRHDDTRRRVLGRHPGV